ncbi:hypothetical protein FOC1_g10015061, partial [Fusarium oxysporum f. sp. cubense race 1]
QALSLEDDWTGTTDAASRRRAQTRLNMRAYRTSLSMPHGEIRNVKTFILNNEKFMLNK